MLIYKCAVRINSFWLSNVKDLQLIKRHARWLHANTVDPHVWRISNFLEHDVDMVYERYYTWFHFTEF